MHLIIQENGDIFEQLNLDPTVQEAVEAGVVKVVRYNDFEGHYEKMAHGGGWVRVLTE